VLRLDQEAAVLPSVIDLKPGLVARNPCEELVEGLGGHRAVSAERNDPARLDPRPQSFEADPIGLVEYGVEMREANPLGRLRERLRKILERAHLSDADERT
jgi:hypothetical protein